MKTKTNYKLGVPEHIEQEDLISYLDGELEGASTTDVRRHLESCLDCRKRLGTLERSIESFLQLRQDSLVPRDMPPAGPSLLLFRSRLTAHQMSVGSHS